MKRFLTVAIMTVAATITALAQNTIISGKVVEQDTKEAAANATVQLIRHDSTFVVGTITSSSGSFRLKAPGNGKYILKISYIGFKNYTHNVTVGGKDIAMGTVSLSPNSIMLKGATVTGHAAKVQTKADTFVYNADAYRVPEGSALEELVKKLPGATVDDDGTIKVNGKQVKKILVEGKEFFTGDTKTAMKNLPTSMVDKIKAYDQKSDLARVTGIDDGEEQTVLDIGVKPGMNKGFISNNDIAAGTDSRYSARIMGGLFEDKTRVFAFANANNTNDMGFPGGGGRFGGGGQQGLNANKMIGVNVNYDDKKKFQFDGHVRWNHSDGDTQTKSSSENFISKTGAFTNSHNISMSRSNSWNSNFRFEWQPDTMTDIMFRPSISYTTNDSRSSNASASYNADPYANDITSYLNGDIPLLDDSLMVNTRRNQAINYSMNKQFGGEFQWNRKLNSLGRNITLRLTGNYSDSQSKSVSTSDVTLYQIKNISGSDSTYQTNRYNTTPGKNWSYSAQFTYSEPIFRAVYLQFSYQFKYSYKKSERSTYDFSNYGSMISSLLPQYRDWDGYISMLPNQLDTYLDDNLSRSSEYKNYNHDIRLMLRVIRPNYRLNAGVQVMPQKSNFKQNYLGHKTDTVRTVTNIAPRLDFRYKFSNVSQLRLTYRGSTDQPDMTDLLDITDDSDPLNIKKGNPGLKPSFTNDFRLFYNNYIQNHQRGIMANISFSNTQNSISNMVTYNDVTGGRITQPQNINGNWNANAMFMFNTSLDSAGVWNVNTFSTMAYNHYASYLFLSDAKASEKNITRSATYSERLSGSYRNDWFEFELNGTLNYTHTRNELQATANLDTWQYQYGANVNVTLPWKMRLATDIHESSRRGYNESSMNTNELIWNAQISQSFLSGSPLTISLQFYDILGQQSNFSRMISATQRSDTQYNAITSYAMLHAIYRFNAFGNKDMRQMMRNNRKGRDNDFDGPPGGGFGGNHPHGGGFGGGGFGGPR